MGKQSRLNVKKRLVAGTMATFFGLISMALPATSYAADVVSYSKTVSAVPGFDASNPNYSGSTNASGSQGTASGTASSQTGNAGSSTVGGPKVIEVTPSEQYYDDYEIYSESINGQYYFYANVANNGITDQPVSVDFPANMTYTMEKDGVVTEYLSKQTVSDYGTYLFRISITDDAAKPVSEQTVYKSIFVFRIQPKVEKPTEAATEAEEGLRGFPSSSGQTNWDASGLAGLSDIMQDTYRPEDFQQGTEASNDYVDVSKNLPQGASGNPGEGTEAAVDETKESEEESSADMSGGTDDAQKEEPARTDQNGITTVYVAERGVYRTEYPDGSALEVTNPNGMIGNTKIYVGLEDMGENPDITVLRNGKKIDFPDDGGFDEPGDYTLLVRIYEKCYPYSFRILNVADGQMDSYTLPEGIELKSFVMDGRSVNPDSFKGADGVVRLDFSKEGSYEVTMTDPDGPDFTASLVIDRTKPEVSVTQGKNSVQFTYDAQDISEIIVNNGKTEESYSQLSGIDRPGNYIVEFYDYAGNMTSVAVNLKRQINMASVAAGFMILGLIALIVIFYKRTKGEMNVK